MEKRAFLNVRDRQDYKKAEMIKGLERLGYRIVRAFSELKGDHTDLLISWNLHSGEGLANNIRSRGGTVIVAENPYVKYDKYADEYLALQRDGHNGSGSTPTGGTERLERLGLEFKDWKDGNHILVADQRGIGSTRMRSPPNWGREEVKALREVTGRPIVLRSHPGRVTGAPPPPLAAQLQGAYAVVVWASNVATTALLEGVPVFYEAPHITLAKAAKRGIKEINRPWKDDRTEAFVKLSWSQWSLKEIADGEALQRIIECTSTPPDTSSQRPSAKPSPPGPNNP